MKLKLTFLYVVAFLSLVFLVHELHDWAHTFAARILGSCWGPRAFDYWDFCSGATVSSGQRALATIVGPAVNFVLLWIGWQKMDFRNTLAEQSLGCSLVFAALPFTALLAAARGGGDITTCLRLLFTRMDKSNHHALTLIGLLIQLVIYLPPLFRAFSILPWWQGRLFFFPVALIVPGFVAIWQSALFNRLLFRTNDLSNAPDAFGLAICWTVVVFAGWFFTRRSLKLLISDEELPL